MRAHIHLNPSFPGVPFRTEQRDPNLPATPMLPPGIQTFPRASQGIRPALTVEPIQRDRRGGDTCLLDPAAGGVLPRVARPDHGDPVGPCDLPTIPGQEERTGELPLDESRDRPVVVLHSLEVDAQPDRAVTRVVPGVPLDTLIAVRDAQDATGWAAESPSAASEDISEAALEGVGGVGGDGYKWLGFRVGGRSPCAGALGGLVRIWRNAVVVSPSATGTEFSVGGWDAG